jgi:tetratricopeptide (TPR) repeat protein
VKDDYDQPEPRRVRPAGVNPGSGGFEHSDWYAPEDDSRIRALLLKYLPILFLSAAALFPAWTQGKFLWQDDIHVTANNPLRTTDGLGRLWRSPTITPDWAPLSYTLLWPQHYIWQSNYTIGYHLVSLFLHSFNAIMVWMLLRRLDVKGAFLGAIVFALHPMQAEAVAWIGRQPMLFGTFWGLLFALLYLRYSGADNTVIDPSKIFRFPETPWLLYAFAIVTYLLAVLSYPLLVCTLPLVMLVIAWWKKDDFSATDVYRLLPLIVMGVIAAGVNWFIEFRRPGMERSFSGLEVLLIPGRAVWFYIGKFLFPVGLATAYRPWTVSPRDVLQWLALASIVVIAAALWLRRREVGRTAFAPLAIYLLLLLPMITPLNRVEMQGSNVADRFHYLAMAAAAGVVIGVIGQAMSRVPRHQLLWIGGISGGVLTAVLAVFMWIRSTHFKSPLAMWENTVAADQENYTAHIRLGKVYQEDKDKPQLDKAIGEFERVDRVNGGRNLEAKIALGELAEANNDIKLATEHYRAALAAAPDSPEPYRHLGQVLVKQKQYDEAAKIYQDGLTRFPKDADLNRLMGIAVAFQSKPDEAIGWLKKSIEINPYVAQTHVDYANVLQVAKKYEEAIKEFNEAVKLDPKNYEAYMGAGLLCLKAQNFEAAFNCFANASYFRPEDPDAWHMRGITTTLQARAAWIKGDQQMALNKIKEATTSIQRATELKPDFEVAKRNLAATKALGARIAQGPPDRPATQATQPTTRQ